MVPPVTNPEAALHITHNHLLKTARTERNVNVSISALRSRSERRYITMDCQSPAVNGKLIVEKHTRKDTVCTESKDVKAQIRNPL